MDINEIKQNELRVGNFLHINVNIVKKIIADDICFYKMFEPISLTEEWFLKLNFKKHLKDKSYVIYSPCGKAIYYVDGYVWFCGCCIEIPIKYVHQLQNLYFALTGEELELL